jgi:hypothetical protein
MTLRVVWSRKFAWLGKQMGLPVDVVAAEFNKRQRKANDTLKEHYKRKQRAALVSVCGVC